ncbi:cation:proton antiporter [Gordonibacter urolithinfaciens]|uniref:Cation:proton antiporter n=1 Tax=Gordonibacter urolithinfaciens TaxID=1335613 RepID=A0A7K0IB27_9ACTN|nr:cation:proton antiporter [Gordonibacter urolithinfaciens]MSA94720.1 cation:proton antiporter [Gordonibacter urolithinfaciens]
MPVDLISLAIIALVAAACPILAKLIPGKLIPETVFLLIAGAVLGPNLVGAIELTDSVGLLSDLGLAFLFLLAGYEINPRSLTGSQGKRGLATWAVSIVLAFLFVHFASGLFVNEIESVAVAIALTTTALGTLMPILKERELMGTRVGESVLAYGTWGELCPVLAMALLLSTRAEWKTVLILVAFMALCVLVAVVPAKAKKAGHRLFRFLTANAEGTSQTMMRVTVLLLVGLVALSAAFDLDIVLGAFASGFVLRYIIPEGDHALEHKLDGVAYGFLIPIFFVVSGAKIDLAAVFQQPEVLVGFIALLLLIRAVPIFVALSTGKDTRDISTHNRLTIALYCTTALPIIVAVTSVAVSAGAMPQETASVLVAAGAITVFLMPLLGMLTYRVADAKPIEAVREIAHSPRDIGDILREHWELERMLARKAALERLAARHEGRNFEDLDWQDRAALLQRASARKRAIDEALDLASQEMARRALVDDADPDGDGPRLADRQQRREERRRLVAEHAVREYRRRMNELGGAAERMGVSREDARRLFEDAREMRESALRDRYGTRAGHDENGDDGPRS